MTTVSEHQFRRSSSSSSHGSDRLSVSICEVMQKDYGLYVWPCSIVLAEYVWQNWEQFHGAFVLELGAGTALPGIVAAKVGALVILTDSDDQPQVLENMKRTCNLNQVECVIQGLTWGQWDATSFTLRRPSQIILGADVLYESRDFDDLFATVKFLLQDMEDSVFITTYQRRSGHRSMEYLMAKWGLQCTRLIDALEILPTSKRSLVNGASIELVEIKLRKMMS
ncbi:unnamed protein product [Sphagnum jensenii]|uniref:Methyltransferase-like protein 23 n=1 Tax=Sphagnum jensenii TaxID=128206 RepID=A0ABP1BZ40_9BRYO